MATGLEWRRQRRELVKAGLMEPTSHGATGYEQGCPCDVCRQANTDRAASKRERRRRETPFDEIPHGPLGYKNYGCPCDVCKEGHRLDAADYRARKKAA